MRVKCEICSSKKKLYFDMCICGEIQGILCAKCLIREQRKRLAEAYEDDENDAGIHDSIKYLEKDERKEKE